jgi:hypothetical protein
MFERAKAACFLLVVLMLSSCAGETYLKTPETTPRGRGFPDICGPGEGVRVCINKCKRVVDDAGGPCTVDPCATNSAGVCGKLLDCVPNPDEPGLGTCQPATPLLCHAAQPRTGDNRCAAGLSCIPFDTPSNTCGLGSAPGGTHDGSCAPPTREGHPCNDSCQPCEPGTSCGPRLPGEQKTCLRLCTGDGDCADPSRCLPTVGFELITDRGGVIRRVPVAQFCACSQDDERPPDGGACCSDHTLDEDGVCQYDLLS